MSFSGTSADIPNPERGFYGWSGSDFINSFEPTTIQNYYNMGMRLVLAKVNLGAYRTSDLPASFLTALNDRFASVRAAGLKVTLLFRYDDNAPANDATAAQITRHLQQLNPVLAANADVIPYMRAGFIGAYGEWWGSASGNSCDNLSNGTTCVTANANRAAVRDALLANVPSTTQIGFRNPADLMLWYPTATQQKRAGSHNDCFLAGTTDSGTYVTSASRTYTQTLTDKVAFGGETCDNADTPLRTSCTDILSEGAQYHLAWLNANYAPTFINAWQAGGCYSTVSSLMGYRLQLDDVSHPSQAARGSTASVAVDLRNVGWARLFTARKLVVTLVNRSTGAAITASAGDLSALPPQASSSTQVVINVSIPSGAQTGAYDMYLSAPDIFGSTANNPSFAVRFANADNTAQGQAWNAGSAKFKVGTTLNVL